MYISAIVAGNQYIDSIEAKLIDAVMIAEHVVASAVS